MLEVEQEERAAPGAHQVLGRGRAQRRAQHGARSTRRAPQCRQVAVHVLAVRDQRRKLVMFARFRFGLFAFFEGKVEVFQTGQICTALYFGLQFRGKGILFSNGLAYGRLSFLQRLKLGLELNYFAYLNLIQITGTLLTVACNKGHGAIFHQQAYGVCNTFF